MITRNSIVKVVHTNGVGDVYSDVWRFAVDKGDKVIFKKCENDSEVVLPLHSIIRIEEIIGKIPAEELYGHGSEGESNGNKF